MGTFQAAIEEALLNAAEVLTRYAMRAARKELRDQGHVLTGSLLNTMKGEVRNDRANITGSVYMNEYFAYLERMLPASRVPYSPGSGAKSSKVVTALERYWKLRGLGPKEARSATFATLNKWKQEGRPTRASFRFSRNGRRLGFLEKTVEDVSVNAAEVLLEGASNELERALFRVISAAVRSSIR